MRLDLETIKTHLKSQFNLTDHCSSRSSLCFVAEIHDVTLGYICCVHDMEIYQVLDVFVAQEVRRNKIGSMLIEHTKMHIGADASMEALIELGDIESSKFFRFNDFVVSNVLDGDVVLLRRGSRFRKAPATQYRM